MKLSQSALKSTLQHNVLEIKFKRRHPVINAPGSRRMLSTLDFRILNSIPGKLALHFKPPTQPPAYDYWSRGLVCSWDLFWQDWRMISPEFSDVITIIPTKSQEDIDKFWGYFTKYLESMSPQDKLRFMNT